MSLFGPWHSYMGGYIYADTCTNEVHLRKIITRKANAQQERLQAAEKKPSGQLGAGGGSSWLRLHSLRLRALEGLLTVPPEKESFEEMSFGTLGSQFINIY